MIKSMLRILSFAAILLVGIAVNKFLESLWLAYTGLSSSGLSSLAALIIMAFSLTMLLPFKRESRARINRVFRQVSIFLLVWITASFTAALLNQPKHASIGLIPAFLYAFSKIGVRKVVGFRIILESEEYSSISRSNTLLMWVAPTPRVFATQGFGLRSILNVLRGRAKIAVNTSGETFIKSFKNTRVVELQGSLKSFVETVAENRSRETAIVCEAKPVSGSFRIRVRIASDDTQALERVVNSFSRLDSREDLKQALEKWLSLKPCVKPIKLAKNGVSLQPEEVPERLLIAGNSEGVEELALQACLSQARRNSAIIIVDGSEENVFESRVWRKLEAEGFKPCRNRAKTLRNSNGTEVTLVKKSSLKEELIHKASSKPIVAAWLREYQEDPGFNAPLKVLTCSTPEAKPVSEADGLLLLNPERELLSCFMPERYCLSLQGKTVMVSVDGVRVLK